MARLKFTLVDPSNSNIAFPLALAADSQETRHDDYVICRINSKSGNVSVVPLSKEASSGEVYALVRNYHQIICITAVTADVVVVPGYLEGHSHEISRQAMLEMTLQPPHNDRATSTVLRPGDFIRIGQTQLQVDISSAEHDVQVGSSIPTADEEKLGPQIQTTAQPSALPNIEVDRSIRAQDSFAENTQSSKQARIVAETPASRQKQHDVFAPSASRYEGSQLQESAQEQFQFSVDSNEGSRGGTPAVAEEESQELLGCTALKRQSSLILPGRDPENESLQEEETSGDSAESEQQFATAQSEAIAIKDEEHSIEQGLDGAGDSRTSPADLDNEETESEAESEETVHAELAPFVDISTPIQDPVPAQLTRGKKRKSDPDAEDSTSKKTKSLSMDEDEHQLKDVAVVVTPRSRDALSQAPPSSSKSKGRQSSSAKLEPSQPLATNESTAAASTAASSTRSAKSFSPSASSQSLKAPRMIFSNSTIPQKSSIVKFLLKEGAKQVENATAKGFDLLVVGTGELKRTSKLLTAVALGKPVVTDDWVLQSSKAGKLLDIADFSPKDTALEKEWDFDLEEAMARGHDRRALFKGKSIFITPALKREYGHGYGDITSLATLAGAKRVVSKPLRDETQGADKETAETIFIGLEKDDIDGQGLVEHGKGCYTKDLISISILRGRLDLDDVKLKVAAHGPKAKGKTAKKVR